MFVFNRLGKLINEGGHFKNNRLRKSSIFESDCLKVSAFIKYPFSGDAGSGEAGRSGGWEVGSDGRVVRSSGGGECLHRQGTRQRQCGGGSGGGVDALHGPVMHSLGFSFFLFSCHKHQLIGGWKNHL